MIRDYNVRKNAAIAAKKLTRYNKNSSTITYETFNNPPLAATAASGGGAATGATGDENLLSVGINTFHYHILGTQTILSPVQNASGLDIGMDQTADDGVEITQGVTSASKHAYTVGTDAAFYFKVKLNIADVSGTDDCAVGFRKAEAYQANIDDYDEMACLNVIAGDINIETILNGGATDTTDTTEDVTDGTDVTLTVYVSGNGVVTFEVDNKAPTTTATFTFDDGEVVIPFLYFLNDTDLAGAVVVKEWECGLVSDKT